MHIDRIDVHGAEGVWGFIGVKLTAEYENTALLNVLNMIKNKPWKIVFM